MSLLDELEVRFFANRDAHLHFALLSDFADADEPTRPTTRALVEAARRRVDELNARHGPDRFLLLPPVAAVEPARERRWMGAERKRGKLAEFNRLLRGATDTSFVVQHGDTSILPAIRYVITLDSDSQLPMEAGAAAGRHALASAEPAALRCPAAARDRRLRRAAAARSASASSARTGRRFRSVFSGHVGVDPYTTAVSDLYQDMFHEGSYVGKGIYDVDAFEAALAGRVPENTLLSHDLFEGFYARAGLRHRHRRRRRLPGQLHRLLRAPAPVGARRLADRALAVADGPRRERQDRPQHAAGDLALEDPRQPAAQSHSAVARAPARGRLDDPARIARALDDARGARAGVPRLHSGGALARQPRAWRAAARASARRAGHDAHEPAAGGLLDRHPRAPERGDARRDRARARAAAGDAAAPARVGDCGSGRQRPRVARGPSRGGCGRRRSWPWGLRPWSAIVAPERLLLASPILILWCISPALAYRLGAAPGASPDGARQDRADAVPGGRAAHVAILRGAGRTRRTTGWSPTTIRRIVRTSSPTGPRRPISGCSSSRRWRPATSAISATPARSIASSRRSTRCCACSAIAATSTTGTTRARSRRSCRRTSPRSTAATSPGYLLALRSGLASFADTAPLIDGRVLEGIEDAINLFEAEVDALNRGRATSAFEAGARQPAHAPRPPARSRCSSGAGCSRSSKNACRPSASSSTISRSRCSTARPPRRCRRR